MCPTCPAPRLARPPRPRALGRLCSPPAAVRAGGRRAAGSVGGGGAGAPPAVAAQRPPPRGWAPGQCPACAQPPAQGARGNWPSPRGLSPDGGAREAPPTSAPRPRRPARYPPALADRGAPAPGPLDLH
ncbi:uncharacterized protein LOC106995002 [Macaca mulatta]|uniref:proline-rich proteoglycan 2-like n=1 Tax=Macaca mulatta TaxID=9544 RepID=UPI0010A26C55|nr:proline-rich proteoglycan 2-like [Macaca mulatta]